MKISNLLIENYRNIEKIDIQLENITTFIGSNNSGKSNILRAVTLPFLSNDVGYNGKNISWFDINNSAKKKYYEYIFENQKAIIDDSLNQDDFAKMIPRVTVEVTLEPKDNELYFVKDLSYEVDKDDKINYGIVYNYFPKNIKDVLTRVKEIIMSQEIKKDSEGNLDKEHIETVKMNLLPIDLYSHSIKIPKRDTSISYDTLKLFKYTSLIAERDEFSQSTERLGSKSLVKLLQM
ncbi:TPA: ATP-binding protein, partial [Listeria monocytogenes]|nr:ATP-binding protein [Listeria monocytogenes]